MFVHPPPQSKDFSVGSGIKGVTDHLIVKAYLALRLPTLIFLAPFSHSGSIYTIQILLLSDFNRG
jgi:hypothetical protein